MSEPVIRALGDFIVADVKQEPRLLDPWLPDRGIAMVAGERGLGKTMLAMAVAIAIAGAGSILGWTCSEAHGVLYVDGEMALAEMQQRAQSLLAGADCDAEKAKSNLFFLCDADQEHGIKNLVEYPASRRMIEGILDSYGLKVLILDNLSALCNSGAENDVESWTIMQDWLRKLRRAGYTVIFLHHTTKPDKAGFVHQRGTSKREDILNSSLLLVRVKGVKQGFRVLFTKHRGFNPDSDVDVRMIFTDDTCRIVTATEETGITKSQLKLMEKEL